MYYFLTLGFSLTAYFFLQFVSFSNRNYKFTAGFIALFFSILCSFRFIGEGWELFGGIDAHGYKAIYQQVTRHGFLETFMLQPWEYGFSFLYWISSNVGISFEIFQLVIYTFFYYTIIEVARRYCNGWAAFLLILCLSLSVVDSFNLLRTYLALFVGIWSIFFYVDKRFKTAWLLVFFAISIHVSSLSFLIIYIFSGLYASSKSLYRLALVVSVVFSVLFSFFGISFLLSGSRVSVYLENDEGLFAIGTYLVALMYWVLYSYLIHYKKYTNKFVEIIYPALGSILILVPVHYVHYMAYRMLFPYIFIIFVLSAVSLNLLKRDNFRLKAYSVSLTFLFLAYPFYRFYGFVSKELENKLSAQLYMFDWDRFIEVISVL